RRATSSASHDGFRAPTPLRAEGRALEALKHGLLTAMSPRSRAGRLQRRDETGVLEPLGVRVSPLDQLPNHKTSQGSTQLSQGQVRFVAGPCEHEVECVLSKGDFALPGVKEAGSQPVRVLERGLNLTWVLDEFRPAWLRVGP